MREFFKGRSGVLLLAVIGLASIAILASGLREVSFRPGRIMAEEEAQTASLPVARLVENLSGIPLWKQIMAWGIVFLIVLIVSTILSPELRKRVLSTFLRFTVILAGLYYLARNYSYLFRGLFGLGTPTSAPRGPDQLDGLLPPVFEAPHVSPVVAFLVSAAIVVALAGLFWALSLWWKRRQAFLALQQPRDEIAGIARESLERLSTGSAWDDVIMESYLRMSDVVANRRGLRRHHAVTTSEFAAHLEKAGIPGEAVQNLTRLFERVRYGSRHSSQDESAQAVSCLTTILNYCGEPQ